MMHTVAIAARAVTAAGGGQHPGQPRTRIPHGGRDAEERARRERDRERESEHRTVDRDRDEAWQLVRSGCEQRRERKHRECKPERTGREPEQRAFAHHAEREPGTRCAERRLNGELARASLGAYEMQVSDVHAGDGEQHDDCAEQHPEHILEMADERFLERLRVRKQPQVAQRLRVHPGHRQEGFRDCHSATDSNARLWSRYVK